MSKRVIYKEWVFTNIRNQRAVLLTVCVILLGWNSLLSYQVNKLNNRVLELLVPTCQVDTINYRTVNSKNKDLSSFTLVDAPVLK